VKNQVPTAVSISMFEYPVAAVAAFSLACGTCSE
jgi:hypothetical protein